MRFGPAVFFSWCASASLLRVNLDEKRRHAGNASDVRVTSSRSISTCAGTSGHGTSVYTCDQDTTHRVCATLVQSTSPCTAKQWGSSGTFWYITGQNTSSTGNDGWKADVCGTPNPGTGWCICMWAFATLINKVGCASVEFECDATDLAYVCNAYNDNNVNLSSAHDCIKSKCNHNSGNYCI